MPDSQRVLRLAAASWLRHVGPLALVSLVAFVPWFAIAFGVGFASGTYALPEQLALAAALAALAWIPQLGVAAAAAPLVRATAAGDAVGFRTASGRGFARLFAALAPTVTVALAVVVGTIAVIAPGCILLVLFAGATAGSASDQPLSGKLLASARAARRHPRRAIAVIAGVIAIDVVLASVLYLALARHRGSAPSYLDLEHARLFTRVLALALALVSPLCGCLLAASRSLDDDAERA
jgi:hypothetical protein